MKEVRSQSRPVEPLVASLSASIDQEMQYSTSNFAGSSIFPRRRHRFSTTLSRTTRRKPVLTLCNKTSGLIYIHSLRGCSLAVCAAVCLWRPAMIRSGSQVYLPCVVLFGGSWLQDNCCARVKGYNGSRWLALR